MIPLFLYATLPTVLGKNDFGNTPHGAFPRGRFQARLSRRLFHKRAVFDARGVVGHPTGSDGLLFRSLLFAEIGSI